MIDYVIEHRDGTCVKVNTERGATVTWVGFTHATGFGSQESANHFRKILRQRDDCIVKVRRINNAR